MGSTAGRCGSVRKDRYRGSYFIVVDVAAVGAEKRRQVHRRGFATERAARVALTQLLAELDGGSYVRPDPTVTVAGYAMANWLPALKVRGRRPSTLESYERNLRVHVFPRIGRRPVADVQPAELDQLYVELLAGARGRRPLAPRSVRYVHTILHGLFRHAMLKGFAAADPCLRADAPEPRTCRSREMYTWTAAQLHEFLAGLPQGYVRAGLFVLATTGMRRGEALGLQWTDVDLDAGELVVRRTLGSVDDGLVVGAPKTDRGRRTVALDAATVAVLREHRLAQRQDRLRLGPAYADDGWVFALADGRPVHPNRFMHAFGRRVTASGLPTDPAARLAAHVGNPRAGRRCPSENRAGASRPCLGRHHIGHLHACGPGPASGRRGSGDGPILELSAGARAAEKVSHRPVGDRDTRWDTPTHGRCLRCTPADLRFSASRRP